MSHPTKMVDKEFRRLGARRAEKTRHGVYYDFPDGCRKFIAENTNIGTAKLAMAWAHDRYGAPNRAPVRPGETVPAPTIDPAKVHSTDHALGRFALMQKQAGLTRAEVVEALTLPEKVTYNPTHNSHIWVRGRIAVTATVTTDGHTTIRTILWATGELWDQHPRPQEAS